MSTPTFGAAARSAGWYGPVHTSGGTHHHPSRALLLPPSLLPLSAGIRLQQPPVHDGKGAGVWWRRQTFVTATQIISLLAAFVYDIKMLLTPAAEFYFIYDESKGLGGGSGGRRERKTEERRGEVSL